MLSYKDHLLAYDATLKEALRLLNKLGGDAIVFVVNSDNKLIGSLTDGDIRRGLLKGCHVDESIKSFVQLSPKYIRKSNYLISEIIEFRNNDYKIIPVLDDEDRVLNVINFRFMKSYIPVDAIVMAGGRGSRLKPLTDSIPKPLLKVGEKAIIDHNLDRLRSFGIDDFYISVRYLAEKIQDHYHKRGLSGVRINFVKEIKPLGTIGAVSLISQFCNKYVLITNSDILTNLNYEEFFLDFLNNDADLSIATFPYSVDVPYAVLETKDNKVVSFKEKPTYTYFSNGGIYLVKKEILKKVPSNQFYNMTDLIDTLVAEGKKVISFPIRQYWLDVGKHLDLEKAQKDILYLDL